jgi:hypothetical protein
MASMLALAELVDNRLPSGRVAGWRVALRAERKAGQLLREMEKAKGGGERQTNGRYGQRSSGATAGERTLPELGVSKQQSSD